MFGVMVDIQKKKKKKKNYVTILSRPFNEFHVYWHNGRYRSRVLLSTILAHGFD